MDGSYMLRMRAYVKPRGLKPREAQLQKETCSVQHARVSQASSIIFYNHLDFRYFQMISVSLARPLMTTSPP